MNASAPALGLSQRDLNQIVADILQRAVGYGRKGARALTELVGCNERTALGWLNGEAAPGLYHTLCLIATVPEFAAEIQRLSGTMPDMDPELQRDISEFVTRIQRRMALDR